MTTFYFEMKENIKILRRNLKKRRKKIKQINNLIENKNKEINLLHILIRFYYLTTRWIT